jgi:hypothetical protein
MGNDFFVGWIGVHIRHLVRSMIDKCEPPTDPPTGLGGSCAQE